jgi:hypothetical protein
MNEDAKKQVLSMVARAESAGNSVDALHWSQAATNAANTLASMANTEIEIKRNAK